MCIESNNTQILLNFHAIRSGIPINSAYFFNPFKYSGLNDKTLSLFDFTSINTGDVLDCVENLANKSGTWKFFLDPTGTWH